MGAWINSCPSCKRNVYIEDEDYPTEITCAACGAVLGIEWSVDCIVHVKKEGDQP